MNKKLLLSFAVFATALSVNAQKPLYKGIAKKSMSVEFQTNAVVESKTEINPIVMSNSSSKKRLVTKTIKDTLSIAGNKKTYGHPHHAFSTSRTMKLKLYKTGNNTEFLSAHQRYDNTQPLKLNGFGVSMTAYHDNTPVVALVFLRSKKTKELDSIVPVELSINVVKNSAGSATSSTRWFQPTTPISISDTFMIEVLPKVQTDSVGVVATGAYYGSTRAIAKIDGTTLTVNSKFPEDDSTYSGWGIDKNGYFKGGFVVWNTPLNDFFVTGKNVLPGTYITAQTGAYTYTVSKSQTVAETNIDQKLKVYNTFNGLLGVNALTDGKTSFNYYMAYDDGSKALESDWLMYPAVEYTVDSDPKANDVCKGTDGTVSVTFDAKNRNVLENPTLNKLAFFQKYLGLDKSKNYFYSTVQNGKGSTKFVGMIDFKSTSLTIDTKLDSLNKIDTLYMVDYILPYGFSKTAAAVTFGHAFPVSPKVTATVTVTDAKCVGEKAKVEVKAIGGTLPFTGTGDFYEDAVVTTNKTYEVLDANKCNATVDAKITAISGTGIAPVVSLVVEDAKCFGDSVKVTVSATGTGVLTGIGVKKFQAVVATKTLEVKNEAGCVGTAVAQIKAAPAKITATATVTAAKCFGDSASVEVKANGGTGVFTGVGIKKFSATAASTQKIEVLDANKCVATVDAAIKAAPVKLEVTTAATTATSPSAADGKATATPTGGTAPYTYAWDNTDKSTTAEIKVVKGTYNVVVKDANNCTVNGSVKVSSLSVESLSISGLSIYPNPVVNELNVKFNAISAATIELVNVAGQVIASKDASEFANVTFDTATLNAGVYFVNIKVAEGVFTQKIIKE
jgi:hypothetical protein